MNLATGLTHWHIACVLVWGHKTCRSMVFIGFHVHQMITMPECNTEYIHLVFCRILLSCATHNLPCSSLFRSYDPTIEATHHTTIRFRKVHFATDIVDTAGMDEYSRLSRNASMGVHGYALLFSIASRQSFERIKEVNDSLLNTLGDAPDVPRVLVGSMHDLTAQRQVPHRVCSNDNIAFDYGSSDC